MKSKVCPEGPTRSLCYKRTLWFVKKFAKAWRIKQLGVPKPCRTGVSGRSGPTETRALKPESKGQMIEVPPPLGKELSMGNSTPTFDLTTGTSEYVGEQQAAGATQITQPY